VNPAVATTSGAAVLCCDYYPWIRFTVNTLTTSGAGTVIDVRAYGYKNNSAVNGGGGGVPSGPCGGDLSGTEPNCTVVKVNGAAVPTSAAVLGSNASQQLIAADANALSAPAYVAGAGTAQAQTATLVPAITALVAGKTQLCWLPSNPNSGAGPTLAVNGLAATTIVNGSGTALVAGDIGTAVACVIYDGTNFELQNPQTVVAGGGPYVQLQGSTPGTQQTGNFNVSGVGFMGVGSAVGTQVGMANSFLVASGVSTNPRGIVTGQWSTDTASARFSGYKTRGTQASPTTVVTGDFITRWSGWCYDGTNYLECSSIVGSVQGTVASTRTPGQIDFYTMTDALPSVLTNRMTIDKAGNVGIGTTGPLSPLHVSVVAVGNGTPDATGNDMVISGSNKGVLNGNLNIFSGDSASINRGGSIAFGGTYTTGNNAVATFGKIVGAKENNNNSDYAGYLSFYTRLQSGNPAEVMRINSNGNVGIGTASPASRFHVGVAPTATANYGTLSIGGGPFDGSTTGKFVGSASGTSQAINEVLGYAGDLANWQVAGVKQFGVTAAGIMTLAGSTFSLGGHTCSIVATVLTCP
jgi:hypothetical protein